MNRWTLNGLTRREFLFTGLGAAAGFSILPPGHRLLRGLLDTQRRFAPSWRISGSSTSYSSRISPTISSRMSSIVTRPAVPPYSSLTMAM